jgi:DNA (cytosine-5)-methyltransferase 1
MWEVKVGSLFSGIGGFDLGLERAGMQIAWQVEIDPFCCKILEKHWPGVKRYGDIKEVKGTELEPVDLICGGPPCQPVSCAGKRRGDKDDRWLWPEALRLVEEIHPTWCLFENPPGFLSMGFDETVSHLEVEGYEVGAFNIPACGVDAPQLRYRIWIVAYSESRQDNGRERRDMAETAGGGQGIDPAVNPGGEDVADTKQCSSNRRTDRISGGQWEQKETLQDGRHGTGETDGMRSAESRMGVLAYGLPARLAGLEWPPEPDIPRVATGVKDRVNKLKALGNALIPQIPEILGRMIMEKRQVSHG